MFQEHALPLGQLTYQNRKVEPAAIKRTMLFTVEGEKDDICAVGQTLGRARSVHVLAALPQAPPHAGRRRAITACSPGAPGQNQIYPMVKNVILQSD